MNSIIFLILRRMRPPLLVLIVAYSLAILGLTLIPGMDPQGNPYHMDFMHAFYFVSYMATTIGFGEIPYELVPAQRMWVTGCIYLTVVSWFYAIGKLVALAQDAALRQVFTELRFARAVRRIREPFYLVCGYGDTGSALVDALIEQCKRVVVIDINQERINALRLSDYPLYVPGLCADASLPQYLEMAGLDSGHCAGVVALTDNDQANLHVAITAKLLNPRINVICRAESLEVEENMASFGTDHIIDPFETFAERLFTALHSPCVDVLHEWISGNSKLREPLNPPHGLWLLCGYGRFGKALRKRLNEEGVPSVVIEKTPDKTGWPEDRENLVIGWGTEAATLKEARIEEAVGIVAGTNHDTNNLSILMTARELNPELFMVARQNRTHNQYLFQALDADVVAQAGPIIGWRIRTLLNTPMLVEFLSYAHEHTNDWARRMVARLAGVLGEEIPEVWEISLDETDAPAVARLLDQGERIELGCLMRDPRQREQRLPCVALLRSHGADKDFLPDDSAVLRKGERLLLCGVQGTSRTLVLSLRDEAALSYLRSGEAQAGGLLWRWFTR
jgi:Trk K+ transport system NAD-binding subunit